MLCLKDYNEGVHKDTVANDNLILVLEAIGVPAFFKTETFNFNLDTKVSSDFLCNPSVDELKDVFWGAVNAVKIFEKLNVKNELRDGIFERWLKLIKQITSCDGLVLQKERTCLNQNFDNHNNNVFHREHYFLLGMLFNEISKREYDNKALNSIIFEVLKISETSWETCRV